MRQIFNPDRKDWEELLSRPIQSISDLESAVEPIFEAIKKRGDKAVSDYSLQFDKVSIDELAVTAKEFEFASKQVDSSLKEAISKARNNISKFHKKQAFISEKIETSEGVICWQERFGIEKVGLYVPGGSAPLFSTVLMLGIPANIAGCKEIILCSPPDKFGNINPVILYTAQLIGINKVYKVGGIQAIAAMSIGTESISRCSKIFGPGNQYVTAAKQFAQKVGTAIDMPAGPSELMVIADKTSNPEYIAADLLSQAEHGPDSQVILVSNNEKILDAVSSEIDKQLALLPRADIAKIAIEHSKMIYLESKKEIIELVNEYAPEHLILMVSDESIFLQNICNAGSIFLGEFSPESAGDYASGTNHTLPTSGFAKSYSGLGVDSFCKYISYQKLSKKGLINLGPTIEKMAEAEQLIAHKNAVSIRLKDLKKDS